MAEPIAFTSHTPRFSIPLLFAGQAQKEFFFNEAQHLIDTLLHLAVEGIANAPSAAPSEGECWIVDSSAQEQWTGMEDSVAVFTASAWKFVAPTDGMTAFDKASGQKFLYDGGWQTASLPNEAQGGTTIDSEARNAINGIIAALRDQAILPRL